MEENESPEREREAEAKTLCAFACYKLPHVLEDNNGVTSRKFSGSNVALTQSGTALV
jgi:hypothetical protein